MPSLIVWMLNGVVMAAVLAKLFVFGEPVTKPLTASSVSYWRSRRQADVYLAAVSVQSHSFLFVFIEKHPLTLSSISRCGSLEICTKFPGMFSTSAVRIFEISN